MVELGEKFPELTFSLFAYDYIGDLMEDSIWKGGEILAYKFGSFAEFGYLNKYSFQQFEDFKSFCEEHSKSLFVNPNQPLSFYNKKERYELIKSYWSKNKTPVFLKITH